MGKGKGLFKNKFVDSIFKETNVEIETIFIILSRIFDKSIPINIPTRMRCDAFGLF